MPATSHLETYTLCKEENSDDFDKYYAIIWNLLSKNIWEVRKIARELLSNRDLIYSRTVNSGHWINIWLDGPNSTYISHLYCYDIFNPFSGPAQALSNILVRNYEGVKKPVLCGKFGIVTEGKTDVSG